MWRHFADRSEQPLRSVTTPLLLLLCLAGLVFTLAANSAFLWLCAGTQMAGITHWHVALVAWHDLCQFNYGK